MSSPNLIKFFTNFLFVVRLLVYSAIASAIIKYAAPHWNLLTANLNVDTMNAIAINLIIFPVAFFALCPMVKTLDKTKPISAGEARRNRVKN